MDPFEDGFVTGFGRGVLEGRREVIERMQRAVPRSATDIPETHEEYMALKEELLARERARQAPDQESAELRYRGPLSG